MLVSERHGVWEITAYRGRPGGTHECTAIARKQDANKHCTYYIAEAMTEREAIAAVKQICDKADNDGIHTTY